MWREIWVELDDRCELIGWIKTFSKIVSIVTNKPKRHITNKPKYLCKKILN